MSFDPVSYLLGTKAGGGSSVTVEPLSVTANGTYQETDKAYSPVTVAVPEEIYFKSATHLTSLFATDSSRPLPSPLPPEDIVINAPNCYEISGLCKQYVAQDGYNLGIKTVTFAALPDMASLSGFINIQQAFFRNTSVKTVDFGMGVIPVTGSSFATDATNLETIIGTFRYNTAGTWTTADTNDFRAPKLRDVSFYPGCLLNSMTFTSPYLTDTSLVSIANGLDETQTGKTLTHDATAKARCGQILGTVADGVFTQDAAGSVTLTDFITNTKGWTLA